MHELSIASSIVDTVLLEVEKRNLKNVSLISMRIGALTDIVPDSLQFGFEMMTKDTILENTELKIESIPVKGRCKNCHKDFEVVEFIFICSNCASVDLDIHQGNELEIAFIETDG